jgi:hypothetical protein
LAKKLLLDQMQEPLFNGFGLFEKVGQHAKIARQVVEKVGVAIESDELSQTRAFSDESPAEGADRALAALLQERTSLF